MSYIYHVINKEDMTPQAETSIRIDFNNGMDISPIIVFNGVELEERARTFNKTTHQIEDVIQYILEWENSNCDVFV